MIRPFYRSRLFWLGVPGLVFLLWFWWFFPQRVFTFYTGSRVQEIRAFHSAIELTTSRISWASWEASVIPIDDEDQLDPCDDLVKWDYVAWPGVPEPKYYLRVRSWIPSAGYTAVWLGAVAAWQRRKARLLKLHPAPEP